MSSRRPLRVAHVNDIASVGSTMVTALRDAGVDAQLYRLPAPGAALDYPWKALTLPLRVVMLEALGLRLRTARYDVVHVHYATHGFIGPLTGTPFVIHCHGTDIRELDPRSVAGRMVSAVLRRADGVLIATPDLAEAAGRLGVEGVFLPNPVDTERFTAPQSGDRRDVLVATRLTEQKGAEHLVAALERIHARRPDVSITLVAHGPLAADAARAAGPAAEVVPPVPHERMPALLQGHRVVLGPFALGALGQLELEAMACERAVVTSFRFGAAYPELPPVRVANNADEIADATIDLLDRPTESAALGANAGTWIRRHHDAHAIAVRLQDVYSMLSP